MQNVQVLFLYAKPALAAFGAIKVLATNIVLQDTYYNALCFGQREMFLKASDQPLSNCYML